MMTYEPGEREGSFVLGLDGGGTKTLCAVADLDGRVRGIGRAGCANFQGTGVVASGLEIKQAVESAIRNAGVTAGQILTAAYGVAGADREADFDTVASYILPHNPAGQMLLANDTTIALRAGTKEGVGVALICGTGSNCIGFNAERRVAKVGGLGSLSGDIGGGEWLVEQAFIASVRAKDGAAPPTLLARALTEALSLENVEDVIEFYFPDRFAPPDLGRLAPLVFRCAGAGDPAAIKILRAVGDHLGRNAVVCARKLFPKQEAFPVVMGGSILQKADPPIVPDLIRARVLKHFPNAEIVRLRDEPVLGALLFALDLAHGRTGTKVMRTARTTLKAALSP